MRLLLLAPQYPPVIGGAELQAQRLARALANAGVRVTVLTQPCSGQAPLEEESEIRIIRGLRALPWGPLWGLTYMISTDRWVRRLADEWDVLHNQQVDLHSWVCARAAAQMHKPCLLRFACSGTGGDVENLRHRRFGRRLVAGLRHARRFVALTHNGTAELARFGLPESRTRIIPNGVDLTKFAYQPWPGVAEQEPLRLLYVGRLSHQKGLDLLFDALSLLGEAVNFHLRIVGEGPEFEALRSRAARNGIENIVEFCGIRRGVAAEYGWSELLVAPSRFEGMPNVVLESMACGRPVVGTRIDGTAELVADGSVGWLVPPENAHALAEALREVAARRSRLAAMGEAARRLVQARYSLERVAGMYLKEYEAMLAEHY